MFQMDEECFSKEGEEGKDDAKRSRKKKPNVNGMRKSPVLNGAAGAGPSTSVSLTPTKNGKTEPLLNQTIIRLKRRIEDPPSKLLVVSYKRLKTEMEEGACGSSTVNVSVPDDPENCSQVLRLVGTIPDKEADTKKVATTVRSVLATSSPSIVNSFRRNIKTRSTRLTDKARNNVKESAESNRFKVVNSKRGVNESDYTDVLKSECKSEENNEDCKGEWETGQELLKLLDLIPENNSKKTREPPEIFKPGAVTCNGIPMLNATATTSNQTEDDDEKNYVYDLYLTSDPHLEFNLCDQIVSVEEFDEDLDFGIYRETPGDEDFYDGDDDSNAEDNYRNDYPDSEEEGLKFEEDCNIHYGAAAYSSNSHIGTDFGKLKITDSGDGSSDDDLIYGIDDDGGNHFYDFDDKYKSYKKRVSKQYKDMYEQYADEVVSSASESENETET